MADARPETTTGHLTVEGVARIPEHDKVLAVYFNRDPTDAELTAIHDALWRIVNEG